MSGMDLHHRCPDYVGYRFGAQCRFPPAPSATLHHRAEPHLTTFNAWLHYELGWTGINWPSASNPALRELQLYIDCSPDADSWDEKASVAFYFCELEMLNTLHVLDPSTIPQPRLPPTQPLENASQSQVDDSAVDGDHNLDL